MELRTPTALYNPLRSNVRHNVKRDTEDLTIDQSNEDHSTQSVLQSSNYPVHNLGIYDFNVTIPEYQPLRYPLAMPSDQPWVGAVKPITPPSHSSMTLQPWYDNYGALTFSTDHFQDEEKIMKVASAEVDANNGHMDHPTLPYISGTTAYETPYYAPFDPTQASSVASSTRLDSQQYPTFLGSFLPTEESSIESSSQRCDNGPSSIGLLSRPTSVLPSSYAGSEISENVGEKPASSETGESKRKATNTKRITRRHDRRSQRKAANDDTAPVCSICGRVFERYYNYKSHLQTHNPARPYPNQCDYDGCMSKFTRKAELDRHKQSVRLPRFMIV